MLKIHSSLLLILLPAAKQKSVNSSSSFQTMEISLQTPALLFPALSLIMLAYTNRFLALGTLIRNLHKEYEQSHDESRLVQIQNLRHRLCLIRDMQVMGVLSLSTCVLCMGLLFFGFIERAKLIFGLSLILLARSLSFSVYEFLISTTALNVQLQDLEKGSE